jgi:AGCS family alanine or glycine:cation symporter
MALLSSGVWNEKTENTFQLADTYVLAEEYNDENEAHRQELFKFITDQGDANLYTGQLQIKDGSLPDGYTLMHARSIAEDVIVRENKGYHTGIIEVKKGRIKALPEGVSIEGKSLIHSAPLTALAFNRGFFGDYGQYIVSIGLLLFAFSTAISWSYYGDRSVTFLFGSKYVRYYRVIYVIGFFLAAIIDTTIVWTFSGIAIALMTLPNLIGILLLRKDMKATVNDYWKRFVPGKGIID